LAPLEQKIECGLEFVGGMWQSKLTCQVELVVILIFTCCFSNVTLWSNTYYNFAIWTRNLQDKPVAYFITASQQVTNWFLPLMKQRRVATTFPQTILHLLHVAKKMVIAIHQMTSKDERLQLFQLLHQFSALKRVMLLSKNSERGCQFTTTLHNNFHHLTWMSATHQFKSYN